MRDGNGRRAFCRLARIWYRGSYAEQLDLEIPMLNRPYRLALTLVELVVCLGIAGLILGVLLVAIQAARETARRTQCSNQLRQSAIAVTNHHTSNRALPSLWTGTFRSQPQTPDDEFFFHSWRTAILPELEQHSLFHSLSVNLPATDTLNQTGVNCQLAVFKCPSSPSTMSTIPDIYRYNSGNRPIDIVGTAARSDYQPISFVAVGDRVLGRRLLPAAWIAAGLDPITGLVKSYRGVKLNQISDGNSQTFLLIERAGLPDIYVKQSIARRFTGPNPVGSADHHGATWGISCHQFWLHLYPDFGVNATNEQAPYGFHQSGVNTVFVDGAGKFLSQATDSSVVAALATRANHDSSAYTD